MLYIRILCLLFVAVLFVRTVIAYPGIKLKALYNQGMTCMKAGQFDAALHCFNQVVLRDKNYTAAYLRMGDVYLAINNTKAAEEQYSYVLQREPRNCEALYGLVLCTLTGKTTLMPYVLLNKAQITDIK